MKIPFSGRQDRIEEIGESIRQLSQVIDSTPVTAEEQARARAREIRNLFMTALTEIGAQSTIEAMGPLIRRFRRDVEAKGFEVSAEIYHVYLALELLDNPLGDEARQAMLLAIDGLRAES